MNTFRTSTEITPDHRIVLALPPEMPLGTAEIIITVSPKNGSPAPRGSLRRHFGAIRGGDPHAADNDRIDADLTNAHRQSHD
jgi:hypothetical protein